MRESTERADESFGLGDDRARRSRVCPICASSSLEPLAKNARCTACHAVVHGTLASCSAPDLPPSLELDEGAPAIERPRGYRGATHDGAPDLGWVAIRCRWPRDELYLVVVMSIVWWSMVLYMYSQAVAGGPISGFALLMVFVAMGLALAYYGLCLAFNTTTIRIDEGRLEVRHGHLPWPGSRTLATAKIDRIFLRFERTGGSRAPSSHYTLHARVSGRPVRLARRFEEDEAFFLEAKLLQHLGLTGLGREAARDEALR